MFSSLNKPVAQATNLCTTKQLLFHIFMASSTMAKKYAHDCTFKHNLSPALKFSNLQYRYLYKAPYFQVAEKFGIV